MAVVNWRKAASEKRKKGDPGLRDGRGVAGLATWIHSVSNRAEKERGDLPGKGIRGRG